MFFVVRYEALLVPPRNGLSGTVGIKTKMITIDQLPLAFKQILSVPALIALTVAVITFGAHLTYALTIKQKPGVFDEKGPLARDPLV